MGGLLFKIGGPLIVLAGLTIYHNVVLGKVQNDLVEVTEAKAKVEREKTSLESAIAEQANLRAKAVADALEESNAQWQRQLEVERQLRADIQERNKTLEGRLDAIDREIEEGINEDDEMRAWGDGDIADGWYERMFGAATGDSIPTG